MRKRLTIILLLVTAGIFQLNAVKKADLSEILKPMLMKISDAYLYITDQNRVHIYSLSDFKYLKAFGRKGQGPGEFEVPKLSVYDKHLLICNSPIKVIHFSKRGELQKEVRINNRATGILSVNGGYVGYRFEMTREANHGFRRFFVYDGDLNPLKEIYFTKVRGGRSMIGVSRRNQKKVENPMINYYVDHQVWGDSIVIGDNSKGIHFEIFNKNGEKLREISLPHQPVMVTAADRKRIMERYFNYMRVRGLDVNRMKKRYNYTFPEVFPAFQNFQVTDGRIYCHTHRETDERWELLILDLNGQLIGRSSMPNRDYICFHKGSIYWLEENEESDMWEIHAEKVVFE